MNRKLLISTIFIVLMVIILKPVFSQINSNYFEKGNSMLISGKFDQAQKFYNLAIQQEPNSAEAYLGLGMAYKEQGKYQEAYASTQKAIQLRPGYYQAYYNLGMILENMNRSEEAINAYNKFLDEVPGADKFSDAKQRIYKLKRKTH